MLTLFFMSFPSFPLFDDVLFRAQLPGTPKTSRDLAPGGRKT